MTGYESWHAHIALYRRQWRDQIARQIARIVRETGPGRAFDIHIDHDWTSTLQWEPRNTHRKTAMIERARAWRYRRSKS